MSPLKIAHVSTIDMTLHKLLLGQFKELQARGHEVTGISAPGPWTAQLESDGIRHVAWHNATRSWDLRRDVRAFWELHGILKRERFDVVHLHNPKPGILGRVAGRMTGTPCVVNTVHGYYAVPEDRLRKKIVVMTLEAIAARFSHLELFQSAEDLAWARKRHIIRRGRSDLIGNGTDLGALDRMATDRARSDVRAELGIPNDNVVVGTVGRMVAEKGYREFFEAARSVRQRFPNVSFVAVGDADPAKPDSISQQEMNHASADVVFTGWREDVPRVLAAMDVFVLASWREGVPRSAIEAAACGKPSVLTDIRGCREVIRDGIEGLLVPQRDPARLAEAIAFLCADDAARGSMGAAARRRARVTFDEGRVARQVADHYERLLGAAEAPQAVATILDLQEIG